MSLARFAFQACSLNHSGISPLSGINSLAERLRGVQPDCEVIVKRLSRQRDSQLRRSTRPTRVCSEIRRVKNPSLKLSDGREASLKRQSTHACRSRVCARQSCISGSRQDRMHRRLARGTCQTVISHDGRAAAVHRCLQRPSRGYGECRTASPYRAGIPWLTHHAEP
jgi:hypothetical protein